MAVPCPLCGQLLEFGSGSWAYIRSNALLHIQSCDNTGEHSAHQLIDLASRVADQMTAEPVQQDELRP